MESVRTLFSKASGTELVAMLFRSSRQRLACLGSMTISTYCEIACRSDPGWATLGMFLVALSRAAEDMACYPPMYTTPAGQQRLQKLALHYADQCLEICLSLDCLNDLQLMLQYENFIAHSMIDGDQSKSWNQSCRDEGFSVKSHDHLWLPAFQRATEHVQRPLVPSETSSLSKERPWDRFHKSN